MDWITDKLDSIKNILTSVFVVLVIAMASKEIVQRKLISIFLLIVAVGLLGWFVFDTKSAINTLKGLWQ